MHHLPSFRNSFNACDVSLAPGGEKTGFFFPPKNPKMFAGGRCDGIGMVRAQSLQKAKPHAKNFVCGGRFGPSFFEVKFLRQS